MPLVIGDFGFQIWGRGWGQGDAVGTEMSERTVFWGYSGKPEYGIQPWWGEYYRGSLSQDGYSDG